MAITVSSSVFAQGKAIPANDIKDLNEKLSKVGGASSSARKKLSVRRVIRECESILTKNASADNRYEVLSILFKSQQYLLKLDNSSTNRKAFLDTCKKLAAAPNKYAAIRRNLASYHYIAFVSSSRSFLVLPPFGFKPNAFQQTL